MSHAFKSPTNAVLSLLASFVVSATAHAQLFNNFGAGDTFKATGRVLQGPGVGTIGDVNQANQFTVGSVDSVFLGAVLGINSTATGQIDVIIAADAGDTPGATLQTESVNVVALGEQTITASFDGSLELDANTDYWIIADAEGSFDGSWRFNSIGDMGLTAGQTEGNAWNVRNDDERYAMRIQGREIPIPEPSSVALLVSALVVMSASRRVPR